MLSSQTSFLAFQAVKFMLSGDHMRLMIRSLMEAAGEIEVSLYVQLADYLHMHGMVTSIVLFQQDNAI